MNKKGRREPALFMFQWQAPNPKYLCPNWRFVLWCLEFPSCGVSWHLEFLARYAHCEHRAGRLPDHFFRRAAKEHVVDAGPAVRADDDHVGVLVFRRFD